MICLRSQGLRVQHLGHKQLYSPTTRAIFAHQKGIWMVRYREPRCAATVWAQVVWAHTECLKQVGVTS